MLMIEREPAVSSHTRSLFPCFFRVGCCPGYCSRGDRKDLLSEAACFEVHTL